jgi:hypothetical protein
MKFPNLETVILFGQFVFLFQADRALGGVFIVLIYINPDLLCYLSTY